MLENNDMRLLNEIHDEVREQAAQLGSLNIIRNNLRAKYRKEVIVRQLRDARLGMRKLRDLLLKEKQDGRRKGRRGRNQYSQLQDSDS